MEATSLTIYTDVVIARGMYMYLQHTVATSQTFELLDFLVQATPYQIIKAAAGKAEPS